MCAGVVSCKQAHNTHTAKENLNKLSESLKNQSFVCSFFGLFSDGESLGLVDMIENIQIVSLFLFFLLFLEKISFVFMETCFPIHTNSTDSINSRYRHRTHMYNSMDRFVCMQKLINSITSDRSQNQTT